MTDTIDTLVIGAGVVGLAMARTFARTGRSVLVAEQADAIGTGISSRNSEVIHAGIYYPPGSLKARMCVAGKALLYDYCERAGVEASRIGKLIVAQTEAELPKLDALKKTASQNGVDDLTWLTAAEATRLEPELTCAGALRSPSTGIVDSHGLMLALQGEAEAHGATVALRTRFVSGEAAGDGVSAGLCDDGGNSLRIACHTLVNCAGLGAHAVAAAIGGFDHSLLPPRFLAKGNYCNITGKPPFSQLIYPIPVPGALGTHVTLDLQGRARLGPNIEWIETEDYSVSETILAEFAKACEGFWPNIRNRKLTPAYCGIRPKVHGPTENAADFIVQGPDVHGVAGLVNLFGIESPGLTSSLALADHVLGLCN